MENTYKIILIITLVLIFLLIGGLIILVAFLYKRKKNAKTPEINYNQFYESLNQIIKSNVGKDSAEFLIKLKDNINEINEKITKELTTATIESKKELSELQGELNKKLALIEKAQEDMKESQKEIISLKDLLSNKQFRGSFGEYTLDNIISSILGEKSVLYKSQYKLPNNSMVDMAIFAKEPLRIIGIDSKFPLENYKRLTKNGITEQEKKEFKKKFIDDVKKHIDDISRKYIIKDVTADFAIMYIPAEVIYSFIITKITEIMDYALKKKIVIASPTTLTAIISTIYMTVKNVELSKNAQKIKRSILKFKDEFIRFDDRLKNLEKSFQKVGDDFKQINITSEKIISEFNKIESIKEDN